MRKVTIFLLLILAGASTVLGQTPAVDIPLTVSDSAGGSQQLRFGLDPSATDGIDAILGESELPPAPVAGVFDARFVGDDIGLSLSLSLGQGILKDYRLGTALTSGVMIHEIKFQVGTGTSILISWSLPTGVTGRLQDLITVTLIDQPMTGSGSYTVTNPASFSKLKMTITYALSGGGTPPAVTTVAATSVTSNSAQLNGTVNPNGAATAYYFEYGTTSYGTRTSSMSAGSGTTATSVSATLSGVTPGTLYHYRVVAKNTAGTSPGSDMTFTTRALPKVVTLPATNLQATSVQLNGTVNPNGTVATCYFEYGKTTDYGFLWRASKPCTGVSTISVSALISGLSPGSPYHYRLVATNGSDTVRGIDVATLVTSIGRVAGAIPDGYGLSQNYPNPFNPSTKITFTIPEASQVILTIVDALGRTRAVLVNGERLAGTYQAEWNASHCASGIYFYRLQAGEYVETKKMAVTK